MPKDRKQLARQILDAFNTGNTAIIDEAFDTQFRSKTEVFPGVEETREGLKREIKMLREAFPDAKFTADDVIEHGNTITIRWTMKGTHKKAILGVEPSNQEITQQGEEVLEFHGDKIVSRSGKQEHKEFEQKLKAKKKNP